MFTVLIVDDNPINLKTLILTLQNDGYQLHSAQSGKDALALIPQINPDIMLLDVRMPIMSGFEVCKKLKESEATANIPIIFLSALDEDVNKVQGLSIGGNDYITKPFSPEEVSARIHVHLMLHAKQKELESLRRQDQQYFEQINAIRDGILDQMRHDVKSPLASIKASAYLIKQRTRDYADAHITEYVERINCAVDETLQMLEHLLELAKLETGRSTHAQLIKLDPFIKNVVFAYRTLAETKGIQFLTAFQIQPDINAYFDPDQIQSVIGNLLSNAIKYTAPNGKISLKVYLANGAIHIEVADTGRGIPKDSLPKIFDRLYRVPMDGEQVEGTGLGLYIVKTIIEQHGGTIQVQSELHKGSTFLVAIPHRQIAEV